jgi:hypothetical protein
VGEVVQGGGRLDAVGLELVEDLVVAVCFFLVFGLFWFGGRGVVAWFLRALKI